MRWFAEKRWAITNALLVVALLTVLGVNVEWQQRQEVEQPAPSRSVSTPVIRIGHVSYAAGDLDFTYDGVDDNVQFQAALALLPVTGGRIIDVSAVQKNFSATVTRAIPNVVIEGAGYGSNFTNDGLTALFTAGGNGWQFHSLSTDAGGINMGATTGWYWERVNNGSGTVYDIRTPGSSIVNGTANITTANIATINASAAASTANVTNFNADLLDGLHAGQIQYYDLTSRLTNARKRGSRLEAVSFNNGTTRTLASLSGSGTVTTIWLGMSSAAGWDNLKQATLRVYVNGEASPAVQTDLGTLGTHFNDDAGAVYILRGTRHIRIEHGGGNTALLFKYPMPYQTGVNITLENVAGLGNATLWSQVYYTSEVTAPFTLRSVGVGTHNGGPLALVQGTGSYELANLQNTSGLLVWSSQAWDMNGEFDESGLEADITFYVDGESDFFAATGIEDWFTSSLYFLDRTMEAPWMYCTVRDTTSNYTVAGLDLLELTGGFRFNNVMWIRLFYGESNTDARLYYLWLYYKDN